MTPFIYILFFIAGVITCYFYYKSRNKTQGITTGIQKAEEFFQPGIPVLKTQEQIITTEEPTESYKKTIDNLHIVNELGRKVTSSLNLQQTFKHLYTTINSMMDAAVLELSVQNEITGEMKVFSNSHLNSETNEMTYTNQMSDWCFKNNREVFLTDAENDYARYVFQPLTLPDGRIARSVIIFPIINREVVSGTLCIISFQKNSFSDYHREIIRLLLGYISVAMDNAIRHDELNTMKIRAEKSEKFKEQFLANMSHEIRTPINAVTGMTHLLLAKQPRADQLRYLESIRNASDTLLVIINDILDLSKIEAGKIELEKIDFSVDDLVNNVRDIMHFKAEEKGLAFEVFKDSRVPRILVGDPTRLTQILINLVGNAIKFTAKGTVSIRVTSADSAHNTVDAKKIFSVRFEVVDTGIGMSADQQSKLFNDYAQASLETSRKYGGTGLGLSISKQLVGLQGGEIGVESVEGKGSKFFFTLTFPVSTRLEVPASAQELSDGMFEELTGIRVLLADDNEYNRIVIREMLGLRIKDIVIDEAFDGSEAIDLLRKNDYDLVLMDLVMPHLDGLEATRYIRNEMQSPKNRMPVIALTASVVKSEIEKCFAAGMNGFIPKPFKTIELFGPIYKVMTGSEQITMTIPEKQKQMKTTGAVDLHALEENAEGDEVRKKRFVELFLEKTPASLEKLSIALDNNNYDDVRIAAHSMKPQFQFTGITAGVVLLEKIETSCLTKTNLEELPGMVDSLKNVCGMAMEELKVLMNGVV